MESNVLKSVEEISGYTPDEMIAMYNDYGRMAKEWEAYASAGLSPEVCAEYRKFEDEVVASGMSFGEVVELMHKERTRWIPVSERLPEYDSNKGAEAYWIAKKTRSGEWQIKIALYSDYGYAATVDIPENVTWRDYDFCQITNVVYWMPLPEAPKETQL